MSMHVKREMLFYPPTEETGKCLAHKLQHVVLSVHIGNTLPVTTSLVNPVARPDATLTQAVAQQPLQVFSCYRSVL